MYMENAFIYNCKIQGSYNNRVDNILLLHNYRILHYSNSFQLQQTKIDTSSKQQSPNYTKFKDQTTTKYTYTHNVPHFAQKAPHLKQSPPHPHKNGKQPLPPLSSRRAIDTNAGEKSRAILYFQPGLRLMNFNRPGRRRLIFDN